MSTLETFLEKVPRHGRVLIIPAEQGLLSSLHGAGYSNLYAISAQRTVYDWPFNTAIRYMYGSLEHTHLPSSFFDCVVVTTHDASDAVLGEADRLIADDGAVIMTGGRVERKRRSSEARNVTELDILLYSSGRGGIMEYSKVMQERLQSEFGVGARLVNRKADVRNTHVIVQFESGLPRARELLDDTVRLADEGHTVLFDVHAAFSDNGRWNARLPLIESSTTLLYRANEVAEADRVRDYVVVPHLSYKNVAALHPPAVDGLKLGTFGFASRGKRHDELILMARRLNIPLKLLLSVNTEVGEMATAEMYLYISELKQMAGDTCEIKDGFLPPEQILQELSDCSHLIFTTRNAMSNSGSIQLGKRLNRPILSLRSFQAQQAQVHQFDSLVDLLTEMRREARFALAWTRYITRDRPDILAHMVRALSTREGARVASSIGRRMFLETFHMFGGKKILVSKGFIRSHTELSRDEDGLEYLVNVLRYGPVGSALRPVPLEERTSQPIKQA